MRDGDDCINGIINLLRTYPHPEDLEWSTFQIRCLLDKISTLEEKVKGLEAKREVKFIQGRADQMVYDAELVDQYRKRAEQAESRLKEIAGGGG